MSEKVVNASLSKAWTTSRLQKCASQALMWIAPQCAQIHQGVYTNHKTWVFLSSLPDFLDVCTCIPFSHKRLSMKLGLAERLRSQEGATYYICFDRAGAWHESV